MKGRTILCIAIAVKLFCASTAIAQSVPNLNLDSTPVGIAARLVKESSESTQIEIQMSIGKG